MKSYNNLINPFIEFEWYLNAQLIEKQMKQLAVRQTNKSVVSTSQVILHDNKNNNLGSLVGKTLL